jgi:hypothetical protein
MKKTDSIAPDTSAQDQDEAAIEAALQEKVEKLLAPKDEVGAVAELAYLTWVEAHAGLPQPEYERLSDSEKNAWRQVAVVIGKVK